MVKFQSCIPNLRSFFLFFSLQSGTCFILWMSMISGIILLLFPTGTVKISSATPPPEFYESLAKTQEIWNKAMGTNYALPPITDPGQFGGEINFGVSWLNIPLGLITIIVSGAALYGIYEENDVKYLFPFIIWSVAGTAIGIISCLFSPFGPIIIGAIFFLINLAMYLYCLWVVWSYYVTSKMTNPQPKYHRVSTNSA